MRCINLFYYWHVSHFQQKKCRQLPHDCTNRYQLQQPPTDPRDALCNAHSVVHTHTTWMFSVINWLGWSVGVEFNAPLDTKYVLSEAVFTASHLTDTDKQNSTGKYWWTNSLYKSEKNKQPKIQQNKTTPVQLPLTTLCQETRWAYSTTPPSPHGAINCQLVELNWL